MKLWKQDIKNIVELISHVELTNQHKLTDLLVGMMDSVNSVDANGNTALHHAAKNGDSVMVSSILGESSRGVDKDILNFDGESALYFAVEIWDMSIVDNFLMKGANIFRIRAINSQRQSYPLR